MVEKKPVNVIIQMVFSVIPILDCYASYKIQKLRLWILILWIAGTIIGIIHGYALFGEEYSGMFIEEDYLEDPAHLADYVLFIIIFACAQAIVMRKWSKKWNKEFKNSTEFS